MSRARAVFAAALLLLAASTAQAQTTRALRGPVTAEGLGAVRVGMPVADAQRALGRDYVLMDSADGRPDACRIMSEGGGESAIEFVVENRAISRVLVAADDGMPAATPATDRNIRQGSPESAVRRAYGRAATVHTQRGEGETYRFYVVWTRPPTRADDPDRRGLQFQIERGQVRAIYAGRISADRPSADCT